MICEQDVWSPSLVKENRQSSHPAQHLMLLATGTNLPGWTDPPQLQQLQLVLSCDAPMASMKCAQLSDRHAIDMTHDGMMVQHIKGQFNCCCRAAVHPNTCSRRRTQHTPES